MKRINVILLLVGILCGAICALVILTTLFPSSLALNKEAQLNNSYAYGMVKIGEGKRRAAEAAYHLGLLKECNFSYNEAYSWYKKALEFNPSHRKAAEALDKLSAKLTPIN